MRVCRHGILPRSRSEASLGFPCWQTRIGGPAASAMASPQQRPRKDFSVNICEEVFSKPEEATRNPFARG